MKRNYDLYFNFREVDSYNKPFNFVISEREPGKTTALINDKFLSPFLKTGNPSVYFVRNQVEITESLITSIENKVNEFNEGKPIELQYSKNSLKTGVVFIKIENKISLVIIAMSTPIFRLKKMAFPPLMYCIMDEFIVNPEFKEKYLPNEWTKFEEIYTTLNRYAYKPPLKCYWCGNPYSHYNPYFMGLGVNTADLKQGAIIVGSQYVVQCYKTKEELKKLILEKNPLYKFDEAYKKYAFDGQAINDSNIQLMDFEPNFTMRFIFRISNKYLAVYKNNDYLSHKQYFIQEIQEFSRKRDVFCIDFGDMMNQCMLLCNEDRFRLARLKDAMRHREVYFKDINCYYLFKEIYFNI